jgi:predicted alpha/beta-fold hydrolase
MINLASRFFRNGSASSAAVDRFAPEFRPLPLLSNPHLQTVISAYWPSSKFDQPTREQILSLPDGDRLLLYDNVPAGWQPGGKIAMLIHGLTGSHSSPVVERTALFLLEQGVRVVRIDQRSAGDGIPLARRTYHAGRSDDMRAVVEEMHRWSPQSPITVVGFSLGGNLALKMAGEAASNPLPGLARVVTVGPPIDLHRCSTLLELPRNRPYANHFLSHLVEEARLRHRSFPDLPPLRLPQRLTVRLYDELYTAPTCGFADALDYYTRSASLPLVPKIKVPTLILTARDDPFIAVEPIESLPRTDYITVQIQQYGGHLGFLGWDGKGGVRWAERRIVDWVMREDLPTRPANDVATAQFSS